MTGDELKAAGKFIFGRPWRQPMAEALRVSLDSLDRWSAGQEIPGPAVVAIGLMVAAETERRARRAREATYREKKRRARG